MIIRPVDREDLPSLSRFFARNNVSAVTRLFRPFPLTEETARQITQEPHRDAYYIASMGEEIVGLSMLRGWDEGYEIPSFGLLVDLLSYNQGIGKQLTQFALDKAIALDCKRVRLSVHTSNLQALRIYEAFGFIETNRKEVLVDGALESMLIMEKEL